MDRLTERNGDSVFILSKVTGWTRSSNWSEPAENAIHRLASYEDSGLSPEEVQELAKAKADGRLVVLKASISQDVWFYDGANRLMQGKVLEYLNCGNGLIYQVQGAKKGLWLHECEIFLTREAAEKALEAKQRGGKRDE